MGVAAHGELHYRGIVVVSVNRWGSRGVLRYKWAYQRTASSRKRGQPIADCRRTELAQVSERPSGDGALQKGGVTRTMKNGATRSLLHD